MDTYILKSPPKVLLIVSGDVFEAHSLEGDAPLWRIMAEAETGTSARTRVTVNARIIADVTIHAIHASQLADEVQSVASAILWSALRAMEIRQIEESRHITLPSVP